MFGYFGVAGGDGFERFSIREAERVLERRRQKRKNRGGFLERWETALWRGKRSFGGESREQLQVSLRRFYCLL